MRRRAMRPGISLSVLARAALTAACACAVGCASRAAARVVVPARFPDLEQLTLARVNAHRASKGLRALSWDETIASQCRAHCARMASSDRYLGHEGFRQRALHICRLTSYVQVSENVGSNRGFDDPVEAAVEGWLESPRHRDAIEGSYAATGIGVDRSESVTYYFTQIFVRR